MSRLQATLPPSKCLNRQMIQSFSPRMTFSALSCSPGSIPSQTMTTGPWLSPQKLDESSSPWVGKGPSYLVSELAGSVSSSLPADTKNGGASMMVHPRRTLFAPYTCCRDRRTVHLGEQCPAFSNVSCLIRALWNNRPNSSGSPLKRARRWVHAPLGIVQLCCACSETANP